MSGFSYLVHAFIWLPKGVGFPRDPDLQCSAI